MACPDRDVIYLYDGTLEGMLCCVFESFRAKEIPMAVMGPDAAQAALYPAKAIETQPDLAERVRRSIPRRISPAALELTLSSFLTCHPEKELLAIRFLHVGFCVGAPVMDLLQNEAVSKISKAVKFLGNEAHLIKEFLRFSDYGAGLVARISPKNVVLPLVTPHFADRLPEERFLIYDNVHGMAAMYAPYETRYLPVEALELPPCGEKEAGWRRLWKQFYQTIAIEGRYNPKCRMSHCPKRYWDNMTELSTRPELAGGNPRPELAQTEKQLPTAMGR